MKILIADPDKAFCLHLPLGLVCNRVGAALLAGGLRATRMLPAESGGTETGQTALITAAQVHGLLKTLKQSKQLLRQRGLPLVDITQSNGSRFLMTL